MIRTFIADDHQVLIDGIVSGFTNDDTIKVIGWANNSREIFAQLDNLKPDIILLDINFNEALDGEEILIKIKATYPNIKVLILTSYNDMELMLSLINNQADGFRIKNTGITQLKNTIINIYNGNLDFIIKKGNEKYCKSKKLNTKEKEMVTHLKNGLSYKQMAEKMKLSVNSIQNYLADLRIKHNSKNNCELIAYLYENSLL